LAAYYEKFYTILIGWLNDVFLEIGDVLEVTCVCS